MGKTDFMPGNRVCSLRLCSYVCRSFEAEFVNRAGLMEIIKVIHLIFSPLKVLSWLLFIVDLVLIAFLTLKAYQDGERPTSLAPQRSSSHETLTLP